jgi:hypothetical protein
MDGAVLLYMEAAEYGYDIAESNLAHLYDKVSVHTFIRSSVCIAALCSLMLLASLCYALSYYAVFRNISVWPVLLGYLD